MKSRRQRNQGFTLIEVMVVIAILGILGALVVPRVMDRPDEARLVKVQSDLQAIESALNLYRLDHSAYPTTEQGLEALVQKPTQGPIPETFPEGGYMSSVPEDPWGKPYVYLRDGAGRFEVLSLGADGQEGGDGIDADISSSAN